jgi:hypothetical protein
MSEQAASMSTSGHAKALAHNLVTKNPRRTAFVAAALAVVFLLVVWARRRPKRNEHFEASGIHRVSNMATGMMNPLWSGGSQADGGLLATDAVTDTQAAVYTASLQPPIQRTLARRANAARMARAFSMASRERMHPAPCKPGEIQGTTASGEAVCMSESDLAGGGDPEADDSGSIVSDCGMSWDPAAVAESQALAAVGGIEAAPMGDAKLQRAISGVRDPSADLSDARLASLMQSGRLS